MLHKCAVKTCEHISDHIVSIGRLQLGACSEHHEAMFELGRKHDEELINLGRKYFHLALNLKEKEVKP